MSDAIVRCCETCLRRSWLVGRLSGHLDCERARVVELLENSEWSLLTRVGGRHRPQIAAELEGFDASRAAERVVASGQRAVCRCARDYPAGLRDLRAAPAVLYVSGDFRRWLTIAGAPGVAVVGTRRASPYGREVARAIGSALSGAGVTVISGLAAGIDAAAHHGALMSGGRTIAVLPHGAQEPGVRRRTAPATLVAGGGITVSELPPGIAARRWSHAARNRLIAALAAATVVVEAAEGSGALLTSHYARELGRSLGAVPGRIGSPRATGPHRLIASGARLIATPQDAVGLVADPRRSDQGTAGARGLAGQRHRRPEPPAAELTALLDALRAGAESAAELTRAGFSAGEVLRGLAALELSGHIRGEAGGRYAIVLDA